MPTLRTAALVAAAATAAATVAALPAVAGDGGQGAATAQTLTLRGKLTTSKVVEDTRRGLSAGDRFLERATLTEAGRRVGSTRADCAIVKLFGGKTAAGYPKADYLCTYVAVLGGDQLVFVTGGPYTSDRPFDAAIVGGTGRYGGATGQVRYSDLSATGFTLRIDLS